MNLFKLIFFLSSLSLCQLYSQTTVVLQPNGVEGKDALLHGLASVSSTNYGNSDQFTATAWTFNGDFGIVRALIDFDLSSIPSGANIIDAKLDLYGWESTNGFGPHSQLSGNNDFLLQRVTSSWDENLVTWNTAPSTSNNNETFFSGTPVQGQNYTNMNVLDLVQDMVDNPSGSHGFMMRLQNENYYRCMNFYSSDALDSTKRPRLTIIYDEQEDSIECQTFKPGPDKGKDAILHGLSSEASTNLGNSEQFVATAWTFDGAPAVVKSIIEFDMSNIPTNAVIQSSELHLYAWASNSGFGSHSTLSGSNEFYVQRITTPWDEQTVTWNTAPSVTNQNQIILPASNSYDEDYIGIPVDALVQDQVSDPSNSFGLQISILNENHYRMVNFCSSDHPNISKHPSLKVCYTEPTNSIDENQKISGMILNLYPNIAGEYINVSLNNFVPKDVFKCSLLNSAGQHIKDVTLKRKTTKIDLSDLEKGIYFIKILAEDGSVLSRKFVKQ